MAQLLVRNLDDDLVRRLKLRAAAKGHSTEAEHRAILEQALKPNPRREALPQDFQERLEKLRAELVQTGEVDDEIRKQRQAEFFDRMKKLREETRGTRQTDSTVLLRQDRDRRAGLIGE